MPYVHMCPSPGDATAGREVNGKGRARNGWFTSASAREASHAREACVRLRNPSPLFRFFFFLKVLLLDDSTHCLVGGTRGENLEEKGVYVGAWRLGR